MASVEGKFLSRARAKIGRKPFCFKMQALMRNVAVGALAIVILGGLIVTGRLLGSAQTQPPAEPPRTREFTEEDAPRVLGHISDALESHNLQVFLSAFAAGRMPDYPVFRDQVTAFFQQYESFQVSYKVNEVAMEGQNGVALADFTIDARPDGGDLPDVRRTVTLRLVLSWNGHEWKVADLSPREVFS